MKADPFAHSERDLVAALGLTQKAVRVVRADELEQKVDWAMVHGEVRYSDTGKARLLSILKISTEPDRAAASFQKNAPDVVAADSPLVAAVDLMIRTSIPFTPTPAPAARAPGAREDLTCFKVYSRNTRIVEAKTADGELVLVRVRENKNLKPGMVMKCRFGGGRIWELAQRLPRYRGRW